MTCPFYPSTKSRRLFSFSAVASEYQRPVRRSIKDGADGDRGGIGLRRNAEKNVVIVRRQRCQRDLPLAADPLQDDRHVGLAGEIVTDGAEPPGGDTRDSAPGG